MNFEHNGTTIDLLPSGKFAATINDKREVCPSLDAIKKRIDNAAKSAFKPFDAYRERYGEIEKVSVVSVRKRSGKRHGNSSKHEFSISNGGAETHLIEGAPENLAAYKALKKYQEETRKILDQRREQEHELRQKLKHIKADDFAPSKEPTK